MAEKLFMARFVEGSQPGDAEWPYTIVSGTSPADSLGHMRIDLALRGVLLALADGHLHVELGEQEAVRLGRTIMVIGDQLTLLREFHKKQKLNPNAYVKGGDAPPAGVPLLALSPIRERELLWEASASITGIRQNADVLLVEIHSGTASAAPGQLTFLGCRFVVLRPSTGKGSSYLRLSRVVGSPFLMLAAIPEDVSHFIVETGDDDVCDVIASSFELPSCK